MQLIAHLPHGGVIDAPWEELVELACKATNSTLTKAGKDLLFSEVLTSKPNRKIKAINNVLGAN